MTCKRNRKQAGNVESFNCSVAKRQTGGKGIGKDCISAMMRHLANAQAAEICFAMGIFIQETCLSRNSLNHLAPSVGSTKGYYSRVQLHSRLPCSTKIITADKTKLNSTWANWQFQIPPSTSLGGRIFQ
ncbi:hypothetical protein TcWFU_000110 [Taenia crassiceps]|uniref:Uncharacterized protein n=1 Tax=Taenia crassiceps TaxID=6207 RepID=A0ABR4QAL6_9CEST